MSDDDRVERWKSVALALRAELAAANTRLRAREDDVDRLIDERDALAARCAELEESTGFMAISDLVHKCNTQIARAAAAEAKNVTLQATLDRVTAETESVIDAIEETFLPQLPSKALSYCAQEDVNAGLDAMRERFGLEAGR